MQVIAYPQLNPDGSVVEYPENDNLCDDFNEVNMFVKYLYFCRNFCTSGKEKKYCKI